MGKFRAPAPVKTRLRSAPVPGSSSGSLVWDIVTIGDFEDSKNISTIIFDLLNLQGMNSWHCCVPNI